VLERRGVPNYFGEQRFGRRANNDLLGAALIRGDNVGVLKLLLGSPDPKLDDNACLPGRCLNAHATRSSASICSSSALIASIIAGSAGARSGSQVTALMSSLPLRAVLARSR